MPGVIVSLRVFRNTCANVGKFISPDFRILLPGVYPPFSLQRLSEEQQSEVEATVSQLLSEAGGSTPVAIGELQARCRVSPRERVCSCTHLPL